MRPLEVTVWPDLYSVARGLRVTRRSLLERIKSPRTYATKEAVPRFSAAVYMDSYRDRESLIDEGDIVTDCGDYPGGAPREQIEAAFAGLRGFAYTSWSSTPEEPRYRVGIELSRRADADEHDRIWRAIAELQTAAGLKPDTSSKGAPHAWALPARHEGDHYEHFELHGETLDVDAALARFPKADPMPLRAPHAKTTDSYTRRLERARRYLEKMPGGIQGSNGSTTTLKAAIAMVRGFALDPDDALRLLIEVHNGLCAPPWSERELVHKVMQAYQRARVPFGAIADRRSERRSA